MIKKLILLSAIIFVFIGCSKGGDGNGNQTPFCNCMPDMPKGKILEHGDLDLVKDVYATTSSIFDGVGEIDYSESKSNPVESTTIRKLNVHRALSFFKSPNPRDVISERCQMEISETQNGNSFKEVHLVKDLSGEICPIQYSQNIEGSISQSQQQISGSGVQGTQLTVLLPQELDHTPLRTFSTRGSIRFLYENLNGSSIRTRNSIENFGQIEHLGVGKSDFILKANSELTATVGGGNESQTNGLAHLAMALNVNGGWLVLKVKATIENGNATSVECDLNGTDISDDEFCNGVGSK